MLHIWHLLTTASCLFLCLTCPYLVTECKNHHDEQLNVEQAEVQTNYDNPQHKKFSLTNTEKDILSTQAELLTKQIDNFYHLMKRLLQQIFPPTPTMLV